MKKRLVFIIPALLLLGFLAFKPPAIGSEKGNVIVTPEATVTPSTKPKLRDFDDEGKRPDHFEDHFDDDDSDHPRPHRDSLHEEDGDEHHDDFDEEDDD
jgi:hypothetical protein